MLNLNNNYKVTISRTDLYSKKYENISIENNKAIKSIDIKKGLIEVLTRMTYK